MKNLKKVLALVLAVVMIMGTVAVASAKDYKDVKNTDSYADAIDVLSNLNILDGYKDGNFKPEGTLTRAEAAKLIAVVNNAKTTGKIKSGEEISALYENTQNYFVDCNDSWARPLINYCRIMGLADGMTATTYEPQRTLTGVQWLKLMLTTLGFDTAKEGYTGTGWDVNVLNRANEIGLTAGLPKEWKGIKEITRGEAAQILFNALTKYLVEYGQKIKNYTNPTRNDKFYNAAFVSNEQVEKSDKMLGNTLGLTITAKYDVFGRPGTMWADNNTGWSKFYMASPVASFTGKTSLCDILVGAGIAKTSTTPMHITYVEDGWIAHKEAFTISHVNRECEVAANALGATGALLQVFALGNNNYIVTRIDTYLAQVTNVKDTVKHGNLGGTSTLTIYRGEKFSNTENKPVVVAGFYDYAVNSYVLTHLSWMPKDGGTDAVYKNNIYAGDVVVETSATEKASKNVYALAPSNAIDATYFADVKAADSKAQVLTGRALSAVADMLTVDGVKTATAVKYVLDKADVDATPFTAMGGTYVFFRDQYDNLIGDVNNTTTKSYAVLDGIVWLTNTDTYSDEQYASAGIVKAGEEKVTDVRVSYVGANAAHGNEASAGVAANASVSTVKALNTDYTTHANKHGVVAYTVDANDKYSVTYVGEELTTSAITATNPILGTTAAGNIYADEETVFTLKVATATGYEYKSYTGIKNVPTLKPINGATMHAVAVYGTNRVATFVYVDATNLVFAGSSVVAFVCMPNVGTATYQEYGVVYTYDHVFVNGEQTTIEVPERTGLVDASNPANLFPYQGLYVLSFNADGKVVAVQGYTTVYGSNSVVFGNFDSIRSSLVIAKDGNAVNLDGAKIYCVTVDDKNFSAANRAVSVSVKTFDDLKAIAGDLDNAQYMYIPAAGASWVADTFYIFVTMD